MHSVPELFLFSAFSILLWFFQTAAPPNLICCASSSPSSSDSESGSQLHCDQLVSPTALAACTRVDSCFAPWFVPSLGVSLQLAQLEIRLCHHLEQLGTGRMQNAQKDFDICVPKQYFNLNQLFLNLAFLHIYR